MSEALPIRYDAMCRAIAEAHAVDEVKDIRDKALALEIYSRQAHNTENERWAIEIRIRAERRCGELLAETERAKGGNPNLSQHATGSPIVPSQDATAQTPTLRDLGISRSQSSRWQKLAAIPQDEFEQTFRQKGKPSTSGVLAKAAPPEKKNAGPETRRTRARGARNADQVGDPITPMVTRGAASNIQQSVRSSGGRPQAPERGAFGMCSNAFREAFPESPRKHLGRRQAALGLHVRA